MTNLLRSGLLILLMLSGCGFDGTPTRHNDFVPLTSIEIVPEVSSIATSHTIAQLTSTKLTVIGNFSGVFTRDITDQVTWKSATSTFAVFETPNQPNRVSGIKPGSEILTATVGGVSSAPFTLTVSSATIKSMTISPVNPSVASGLTTQFAASGSFSDLSTQDLTFDASWSATLISSPIAASVSNDPASKGLAKGLAAGTATITASFGVSPDSATASTILTVTPATLKAITVTPANSTIAGFPKTVNFTATGTFSDGTTTDVTSTATWTSSSIAVATITTGGVATTVAAGSTTINATLNGVSGSTNLTVTALNLKTNGLAISPTSLTLNTGGSGSFVVTATFTDNSTQNVTTTCQWTSNLATVATVSTSGVVTAVGPGSAAITATFGGQPISATVTVQ